MEKLLSLVLTGLTVHAQEFEVASIKRAPAPIESRIRVTIEGGPGSTDPSLFSCRNCSLSILIMEAYSVKYYQLSGLGSRSGELYDIAAKVPPDATKDQLRGMLQNLLRSRFQLAFHRALKEMPTYELTVLKSGLRFNESGLTKRDAEGFPVLPADQSGMIVIEGKVRMQRLQETMPDFAGHLSQQLDLPVIDATRLKGRYDLSLYWVAETMRSAQAIDSGPTLFSAIQSQLGLKLAPKQGRVEMLVVDHIDKSPSGN